MSRSEARVCGFLLTYEYLFNKNVDENALFEDDKLTLEEKLTDVEKAFSLSIFHAVKDNFETLETTIESHLKNNLKIKDLFSLDLAILLSSCAQIDILHEPVGLVINEAVRMSKNYSTDKSPAFVNGVLSSIYSK
jgi:N utilization substance protein B